jgi:glycosyltransferase involved in cell wall biosynthesis
VNASLNRSVALISADFVPTGGMDMPNLALGRYLAQQGREVDVVAYRVDGSLSSLPSVRVHTVKKPLNSYFLGNPVLDLVGRRVGRRVLRNGGRVVVNGGNCPLEGLNWVHYVHAAYGGRAGARGWRRAKRAVEHRLNKAEERRAFNVARVVIANSVRTKNDLIECVGVPEERIRVVYYGIDERFRPPTEEARERARVKHGINRPTLVFVGALGDRRKGFDTLFDAWTDLGRNWDAVLLVVGRGAELEKWKARASSAKLDGSIKFLGFRDDVPDILTACDGMVAPTRYEAFGQAVHEAACCGLPVIVSAIAGVAERLSDDLRDLTLEDADSAAELAQRLTHWRDGLEEHRRRATEHSSVLRQRTWDVMSAEITALLDDY